MEKKRDSFFLSNKSNKTKHDKPKPDRIKQNNGEDHQMKRKKEFDKNRAGLDEEKQDKKPFDKKTYRLKKYSNKYKLDQWEEQRKKKLLRNYYKEVKNDPTPGTYKPISFDEDTTDSADIGKYVRHPDLIDKNVPKEQVKKDPFHRAKEEYNKIKQNKLEKQKDIEKVKEERNQKLQEYKKKKQEKYKKLSKKTKKGQPVMTGRLEILLDKIQKGSK